MDLSHLISVLQGVVSNSLFQTFAGLGVLDTLLRKLPSTKPLSIMQGVASFLNQVSQVCLILAQALDKLLGQNVNPPSS